MVDFCGKMAQHRGVEKVRQKPVSSTVTGAFNQGFLMKVAVLSSLLMMTGGMNMPGTAMPEIEDTEDSGRIRKELVI